MFSNSTSDLAMFPSPCEEDDNRGNLGVPKGWSSERVPPPTSAAGRRRNAAALTPFCSGRTVPSKWEDAERWISSPGTAKTAHFRRRVKSKSGPLGPGGFGNYLNYNGFSPDVGAGDGGGGISRRNSLAVESPAVGGGDWGELLTQVVSPSPQGCSYENGGGISRRDMATQMKSESSSTTITADSSPSRRSSCSISSHPGLVNSSAMDSQRVHSSRVGFRDVLVDHQAPDSSSPAEDDPKSHWGLASVNPKMSKMQREEAKIAAWENLQKAKAEAEIRKLEMKLEKKRASTMDKIMEKLRRAEIKAQKMRSSLSETHSGHLIPATPAKIPSFCKRFRRSSTFSCITGGNPF